ncbi:hypothetical protein KJ660_04220 [Candidatus Micrarchaeota archaeon]|nr:hypothetical protein [Candidatus Micrarchaeota archaeon]
MPILKKIKRGFSLKTGIGLKGEEKKKFEESRAQKKEERYARDLQSYKRQADVLEQQAKIERLRAGIRKAKQVGMPKQRTYGIMNAPSIFSDLSPMGFQRRQKSEKKVKKKKPKRRKARRKRRRIIEYY